MSMQEKLPNGASVSRLWENDKTEMLALFQYINDAEQFAKAKIAEDAARDWKAKYIVVSTYSGMVEVFGPSALSSTHRGGGK